MLGSIITGAVGVAGVGVAVALMSPGVLILMLVVVALGGLIAFIAGWFTMLLRNVVVILCVLVAPVAIAAFILPNTKKLADKWRSMFLTMLAMYPLIAIFTAGAVFAGRTMLSVDSIFTKFGGLIVIAIPMFMLPFMVKKTSGALGAIQDKMTQMGKSVTSKPLGDWVNKNKEGFNDRWRNGQMGPGFGLRGLSNTLSMRKRTREAEGQAAKSEQDSRFETGKLIGGRRRSWQSRAQQAGRTSDIHAMRQAEIKQAGQRNFAEDLAANEGDNDLARLASASGVIGANVLARGGTQADAFQEAGSSVTGAVASAKAAIQKHDREIIDAIKSTADTTGGIDGFREEFRNAHRAGDSRRARAYADLMAGAGTAGLNALGEELQEFEKSNAGQLADRNSSASQLRSSLQSDILGKYKGKDEGLDTWAVGNNTQTLAALRGTGYDRVRGADGKGLSDTDILTQSTVQAVAAVQEAFRQGRLTSDDANRLLSHDAASGSSPQLRAVLEAHR